MKVQNEMATRISIDTISAITSMKDFRMAVSAASSAWRAQEQELKSSGQYSEAVKARISGLNQVMEIQKAKIAELRSQQAGLDQDNEKQRSQWLNLEKQISQANKQLSGYESQLSKAKDSSTYYVSGLAEMQRQYRLNNDVAKSYVASLRSQGDSAKADREELKSLKDALVSLHAQQEKQRFILTQIEHSSGKTSEAYKKQKIQLNKTSEAIGKADARAKELNEALKVEPHPGWKFIRNDILGVDRAEEKAKRGALNFGSVLKANIVGGWIQQGLSSMVGGLKDIITNGMAAAKVGAALRARWASIGLSAGDIKQLSDQVTDLKTNTNLTAQSVNSLQTRFYGMTHSVSQTKVLTQGVASLSDQLKLSDQQANSFAGGLSRIESSGRVTSQSLGRLERQAPGLTIAMSKASGMSQEAFKNLVSSGKMTTDQFNQILAKASADYDKNAKAFGQTSGGAMHRLQQQWATTQAKLAKPLLNVSATGLNQLNKALNNKDTQRGLQMLAQYLAKAAVAAAKFIGYVATHQKQIAIFGGAILGAVGALKAMQGVLVTVDIVKRFSKLAGVAKGIRLVGTAAKFATAGFNPWVIGIELVVGALAILYTHSKTFRKMCSDMGKLAVKAGKTIVKGFKAVINWFKSDWKQIALFLVNPIAGGIALLYKHNKTFRNFVNGLGRMAKNGMKAVGHWFSSTASSIGKDWDDMRQNTTKVAQDMFRKHKQTFKAGYKVIEDRSQTWRDLVSGHWGHLADDTRKTASDMGKLQQRLFKGMYNRLNDMTGGRLGDMVKAWQDKMSNIGDTVANAKKSIHTHFVDLVRGIIKPFNDMLGDLQKGINWVLDKLGASKIGGSWQVPMPSYATGTQGAHPGGFAKVNDGKTAHYREMYRLPNGQVGMFPAVRDMIVPLPKGTSVLDGDRSFFLAQMMGKMPHYANGIGNFFANLKDDATSFLENTDKFLAHPIEFMESVFKRFVHVSTPIKFASDLVTNVPEFIAKQMVAWVKKQFATLTNPGGAGVERWRPVILRAFDALHVAPAEWKVNKLLRQIQTESNGNPLAFQHGYVDANTGGNEARGLLQFAGSTWAADALPGHTDWKVGYNEILAAIHVLERGGEGGWSNVGNGHGWENGGLINQHGMYEVGEYNRPEMIVPLDMSKRSRAYQLLGEIVARFHAEDPSHGTIANNNDGLEKRMDQMNQKFDQLLNMFGQLLGLSGNQLQAIQNIGSLDPKKLYKRQALDAAMRAYS
ncbi:tape measure protein [Limosilactobacillus fermentum]|uniref:tape measure protein n=1 Tax=Limosilactobacillus fermentum TaxID=1613 RepID=UPI002AC8EC6D|nr:tape measure protein [Limosilactobacillus fermentum]